MPQKRISAYKASRILELYALNGLNKTQISKSLNISRGTVIKYLGCYNQSDINYSDILLSNDKSLIYEIYPKQISLENHGRSERLTGLFPALHNRLGSGGTNLKKLWAEYSQEEVSSYKYSQFVCKYHAWRKYNKVERIKLNKWKIDQIEANDLKLLNKWRLSNDRSKWEKAIALLGLHKGKSILDLSKKIERSTKTIKKWAVTFKETGLESFVRP